MKNKIKYIIAFIIILLIVIISIVSVQINKQQKLKGSIEILVNENSYDYLVECANNFMELNDKTSVKISKLDDYKRIDEMIKQPSDSKIFNNIVQINRSDFEDLEFHDLEYYDEQTEILNTYTKNFANYRLNQVKYGDKSIGVPLNSRPLALYIREDMLKDYGYKRDSFNTWEDVIRIGKDIYEKSNGKVKLINATGQDYKDIVDLLIMQNLNNDKSILDIQKQVQNKIQELKDNNILNLEDDGAFLGRISSINAMREIMAIEQQCEWSIGNIPSIEPGTNKFFASEGENLVILNNDNENKKLINKFITYVITNNKETVKYVKQGKFFSSHLYTYKSKEIEDSFKNFVGQNPLIVLSNIEEKTLKLPDYNKYIKVKKKLFES